MHLIKYERLKGKLEAFDSKPSKETNPTFLQTCGSLPSEETSRPFLTAFDSASPRKLYFNLVFPLTFVVLIVLTCGLIFNCQDRRQLVGCRKSASIAILKNESSGQHTVAIWSGMGHGEKIFNDMFFFSDQSWQKMVPRNRPHKGAFPNGRWKSVSETTDDPGGMLVFGGDIGDGPLERNYGNDLWLLDHQLVWQKAESLSASQPSPRRAHAGGFVHSTNQFFVFGGKDEEGVVLNDLWIADMSLPWPTIDWTHKQHSQEGAPSPRKGHSVSVVHQDALLVFGGRNDTHYFNDLWMYNLTTNAWHEVVPTSNNRPSPRDHHAAAGNGDTLVLFGGRSGESHDTAKPVGDVWVFDIKALAWQEQHHSGLHPVPRWLPSSAMYVGSDGAPRMVIFGGETVSECKLNDLYEFNLQSMMWKELSPPVFCKRRCDSALAT